MYVLPTKPLSAGKTTIDMKICISRYGAPSHRNYRDKAQHISKVSKLVPHLMIRQSA